MKDVEQLIIHRLDRIENKLDKTTELMTKLRIKVYAGALLISLIAPVVTAVYHLKGLIK